MTASLNRIDDHRSVLDKLTRQELVYLARIECRDDITDNMPAELMRVRFKSKSPKRLPIPMKGALGSVQRLRIPKYDEWRILAFRGDRSELENKLEFDEIKEVDYYEHLEKEFHPERQTRKPIKSKEEIAKAKAANEARKKQELLEARKKLAGEFLEKQNEPTPSHSVLNKTTLTNLKKMARSKGIIVTRKDSKTSIIRKLKNAEKSLKLSQRDT